MTTMEGKEEWELSKENYIPVKSGRRIAVLSEVAELTDGTGKLVVEEKRKELWNEVLNYSGEDPLAPWVKYLKWVQEHTLAGSKQELQKVLEACTAKLVKDERYFKDIRFLRVWIQYADCLPDPGDVFLFIRSKDIGRDFALFYEAHATYYELRGNFQAADLVYQDGIARAAKPLERLRQKHVIFQQRMAQRVQRKLQEEAVMGASGPSTTAAAAAAAAVFPSLLPMTSAAAASRSSFVPPNPSDPRFRDADQNPSVSSSLLAAISEGSSSGQRSSASSSSGLRMLSGTGFGSAATAGGSGAFSRPSGAAQEQQRRNQQLRDLQEQQQEIQNQIRQQQRLQVERAAGIAPVIAEPRADASLLFFGSGGNDDSGRPPGGGGGSLFASSTSTSSRLRILTDDEFRGPQPLATLPGIALMPGGVRLPTSDSDPAGQAPGTGQGLGTGQSLLGPEKLAPYGVIRKENLGKVLQWTAAGPLPQSGAFAATVASAASQLDIFTDEEFQAEDEQDQTREPDQGLVRSGGGGTGPYYYLGGSCCDPSSMSSHSLLSGSSSSALSASGGFSLLASQPQSKPPAVVGPAASFSLLAAAALPSGSATSATLIGPMGAAGGGGFSLLSSAGSFSLPPGGGTVTKAAATGLGKAPASFLSVSSASQQWRPAEKGADNLGLFDSTGAPSALGPTSMLPSCAAPQLSMGSEKSSMSSSAATSVKMTLPLEPPEAPVSVIARAESNGDNGLGSFHVDTENPRESKHLPLQASASVKAPAPIVASTTAGQPASATTTGVVPRGQIQARLAVPLHSSSQDKGGPPPVAAVASKAAAPLAGKVVSSRGEDVSRFSEAMLVGPDREEVRFEESRAAAWRKRQQVRSMDEQARPQQQIEIEQQPLVRYIGDRNPLATKKDRVDVLPDENAGRVSMSGQAAASPHPSAADENAGASGGLGGKRAGETSASVSSSGNHSQHPWVCTADDYLENLNVCEATGTNRPVCVPTTLGLRSGSGSGFVVSPSPVTLKDPENALRPTKTRMAVKRSFGTHLEGSAAKPVVDAVPSATGTSVATELDPIASCTAVKGAENVVGTRVGGPGFFHGVALPLAEETCTSRSSSSTSTAAVVASASFASADQGVTNENNPTALKWPLRESGRGGAAGGPAATSTTENSGRADGASGVDSDSGSAAATARVTPPAPLAAILLARDARRMSLMPEPTVTICTRKALDAMNSMFNAELEFDEDGAGEIGVSDVGLSGLPGSRRRTLGGDRTVTINTRAAFEIINGCFNDELEAERGGKRAAKDKALLASSSAHALEALGEAARASIPGSSADAGHLRASAPGLSAIPGMSGVGGVTSCLSAAYSASSDAKANNNATGGHPPSCTSSSMMYEDTDFIGLSSLRFIQQVQQQRGPLGSQPSFSAMEEDLEFLNPEASRSRPAPVAAALVHVPSSLVYEDTDFVVPAAAAPVQAGPSSFSLPASIGGGGGGGSGGLCLYEDTEFIAKPVAGAKAAGARKFGQLLATPDA